jgi:hypothetical protein
MDKGKDAIDLKFIQPAELRLDLQFLLVLIKIFAYEKWLINLQLFWRVF